MLCYIILYYMLHTVCCILPVISYQIFDITLLLFVHTESAVLIVK